MNLPVVVSVFIPFRLRKAVAQDKPILDVALCSGRTGAARDVYLGMHYDGSFLVVVYYCYFFCATAFAAIAAVPYCAWLLFHHNCGA